MIENLSGKVAAQKADQYDFGILSESDMFIFTELKQFIPAKQAVC